jgi:hypothetical protein
LLAAASVVAVTAGAEFGVRLTRGFVGLGAEERGGNKRETESGHLPD